MYRTILSLLFLLTGVLSGCSSIPQEDNSIRLPMLAGWFNGKQVYYITTDISDKVLAAKMNANYTPRLSASILPKPRPPGFKSIVERVYVFPGKEQESILPSSPTPLGPESTDSSYSPIWQLYQVHWINKPTLLLKSEEALFKAEDQGLVKIVRTNMIVNCPIVMTEKSTLGLDSIDKKGQTANKKNGY